MVSGNDFFFLFNERFQHVVGMLMEMNQERRKGDFKGDER